MKAGFKAAGYSGVRSTPAIFVSSMNVYTHSQRVLPCGQDNGLTEHDWNVRQKEDQVDQIMLAFPDGEGHDDGLDGDYSTLDGKKIRQNLTLV
jgi:hypothetical protein